VILSPLDDMSYERCVHVCTVPSLTTLNIALRDHIVKVQSDLSDIV
jgi:hypothetical protein